jgi:hypothetical protein
MTVLIILLGAGFVAMAVLLGCLRGFSRALRYRKVSGFFVSVETPRVRMPQGRSKTLIDFRRRKSAAEDPPPRRIGAGTVALMSLVIALGSRGVPGETQPASPQGEKNRVPGVQPLHKSS